MKAIAFLTILAVLCTALAEEVTPAKYAVPRYDIFIPIAAPIDYGWTSPNTEYDLVGHSKGGYNVIIRSKGKPYIAQIPFRDEWGRPTGESSEINIKMRENTFRSRGVTKMSAGSVVLKKGLFYPAYESTNANEIIINYTFMDFSTNIAVNSSDVSFPVTKNADYQVQEDNQEEEPSAEQTTITEVKEEQKTAEETTLIPQAIVEEKPPADIPPEVKPTDDGRIMHGGINAKVIVSSTHIGEAGEGAPEALVDGNLATRWSSNYSEPQHIILEFPELITISGLRLYWETASATRYALSISADGQEWGESNPIAKQMEKPMPRTDYIPLNNVQAKAIRLDLVTRVNPSWGFSLFEIEVISEK